MDIFDRIDVRDLLPVPESPSSPLWAPDLRLLISRLDAHSLKIKSTVRSFLLSHQEDFSAIFEQCSDVASNFERIAEEISGLLSLVSGQSIEEDVGSVVRQIVQKKREAREKAEVAEFFQVVLELDRKLAKIGNDLKNGRVVEAAHMLMELKEALGVTGNDDYVVEQGQPAVYRILKRRWSDCFEEIQELLLRFMENAVQYEQQGTAIHVKYHTAAAGIHGLELSTALKAMDVAGMLNYGLSKTADFMIKYVFSPVVNQGSTVSFLEELNEDLGHDPEAVLVLAPANGPEGNNMEGERMYTALIRIIEFINKFLCFCNGTWMSVFGRLTWPTLSNMIISSFLSKVVPDDASKLVEFQKIRKLTIEFEDALKKTMFISSSDVKDGKLSTFADNVEEHFASRKRINILAKARNILLESSFSIPQDHIKAFPDIACKEFDAEFSGPVFLLFSREQCFVSEASKQLMELVHHVLKDVCLLPPKVALEFYHTARNAISLYEAIIPVKFHRHLDSINQAAVLIHNDCIYFAQEILGLAFQYREFFPSLVKEIAVFVDMPPKFQLMAEEVLQQQIQLVTKNLEQAIDGANGFQNTHQIKQFETSTFAIDQVSFILEKVRIIWEPLLLHSAYEKSMAIILEEVFSRITKEILLLDDMAAEETFQLQKLIHLLFEHLSSLLDSLLAADLGGSPKDAHNKKHRLIKCIRKLRKLAELLDMPLKAITEAWESSELIECDFTSSEVSDFIRAIFTDSPLRKESLLRVENSQHLRREDDAGMEI